MNQREKKDLKKILEKLKKPQTVMVKSEKNLLEVLADGKK